MPLLIDPPALRPGEDPREYIRAAAHVNGMAVMRVKPEDPTCIQPRSYTLHAGTEGNQRNPGWSDVVSSLMTGSGRCRTVCTECLREGRPVLRCWQSASMSYCTRHQCELINSCPRCSKKLQWRDPFGEVCQKCDLDWSAVRSPKLTHFAHNLHRAVSLNEDPSAVGSIGESHSFFADESDEQLEDSLRRLNRVRSVIVGKLRLPKVQAPSTALAALWDAVAGDSLERVIERATATGSRFVRLNKHLRPKRRFPTGWTYLDNVVRERLGASFGD